MREENVSQLIEMVTRLQDHLIPNIKRERVKVDWLYKINIKLYELIKG